MEHFIGEFANQRRDSKIFNHGKKKIFLVLIFLSGQNIFTFFDIFLAIIIFGVSSH